MTSLRRLRHLAQLRVSNVDKKTVSGEVAVRLVNYTDVYYGDRIAPSENLMMATATPSQVQAFHLEPGDVVITKDSEDPADIAVPAYVEITAPDLVCGYHLAILRPRTGVTDGRYLYWAMQSQSVAEYMSSVATGITRYGLRLDSISTAPVPWHSFAEQRAIADFLDTETARIDALIAKKRRLVETLLLRLFVHAQQCTTSSDRVLPLRRCVRQVKTGTTPPADAFDSLVNGDVPWYSPGDVGDRLSLRTAQRSMQRRALTERWVPAFPPESVLVVGIGATAGRVAHLDHGATGNQQMTCLVPDPRWISSRYLAWQLWSRTGELRATAPYTTLPILNNDFLRSLVLHVPDEHDQATIVAELDAMASHMSRAEQALTDQMSLLDERRQALITAAVTGELRVGDAA